MVKISNVVHFLNQLMKQEVVNSFFVQFPRVLIGVSFFLPAILYIYPDYTSFGSIAWGGLLIIMIIRPLSDLLPEVLLLKRILSIRRSIGIFTGMAALTHGIGVFYFAENLDITNLSSLHIGILSAIGALIFSTLMLITSNNFSVEILGKKWKWLHKGIYGMFYLVCIHLTFLRIGRFDPTPLFLGVGVFLVRFLAWKNNQDNSYSQEVQDRYGYECGGCSYVYIESLGDPDGGIAPGTVFEDIPDSWRCPVCGMTKSQFKKVVRNSSNQIKMKDEHSDQYLGKYQRKTSEDEEEFRSIVQKALTGKEEISAMGTKKNYRNLFEDIFFLPAQLSHRVYDKSEISVDLSTIIGPKSKFPIQLNIPFYVSHMSFGSLSREAKVALAKGSKSSGTMICSGEGGLLEEEFQNAGIYVFEYSTGRFGATEENMKKAHAIEIKIGQAAKAGLGGHLLGAKVTEEIAKVRGVEPGVDVISPANHPDIKTKQDLKERVTYLRTLTGGRPIGIKIVASHIEEDLEVAVFCEPDFITIDCRGGATGAAPNHVKDNVCIPAPYAIYRARKFLDNKGIGRDISLLVTGGFRTSADIAKAIALGADAVGLATVAMIGIGCQQYRVCHNGTCPVGIATQNPDLRARLEIYKSAEMLVRLFGVYREELEDFVRILGKSDIHTLDHHDLVTISSEISAHTNIGHA